MKIATFNVNSVRSRLPIILDWLKSEKPDILCLQETKVQNADFPQEAFRLVDYHVSFWGGKAYNGVAVIAKEELDNISHGLDDGGEPDKDRLICAVYKGIPIVNTYIPQGASTDSPKFQYKLEWFQRLGEYFNRHFKADEPLLWLGDLNIAPEDIDVHDPRRLLGHVCFHPEVKKALNEVKRWGFIDVYRKIHPEPEKYSFWDYRVPRAVERKLGWRVDHIMATQPLAKKVVDAFIDVKPRLREKPSDHTPVVALFE